MPRTREDIFQEEQALPVLHIGVETGQRVKSPGTQLYVDPKTQEVCWPALACHNPDCPGRSANGEPYLFIDPDTSIVVLPDGQLGTSSESQAAAAAAAEASPKSAWGCPACGELRDVASETEDERQQYVQWVQPYVLPETEARRAELAEERMELMKSFRVE